MVWKLVHRSKIQHKAEMENKNKEIIYGLTVKADYF